MRHHKPILSLLAWRSSRRRITAPAERFWSKVDRKGADECWPWTASVQQCGYGIINLAGKCCIASRVAWTLSTGEDPGNMLICHRCDNPVCCNPAHLFLGTDADNHRDMMAKKRHRPNGVKGERHMWTKLTEAQVRYIKSSDKPGTVLARELNVRNTTISEIRRGKNWAWLKVDNEKRPADRASLADEKAQRVAALYLSGMTASEVAAEVGLPLYVGVYPLLRRAGVTYRHRPDLDTSAARAAPIGEPIAADEPVKEVA